MRKYSLKAYSLLEASFGLIIMGLITATLVPTIQQYKLHQKQKLTETRFKRIEALLYQMKKSPNGKLPCPALPGDHGTHAWGVAPKKCQGNIALIGVVPFKTLGILERDAKDGYGHYFTYVVQEAYTLEKEGMKPNMAFVDSRTTDPKKGTHLLPLRFFENGDEVPEETKIMGLLISHGPKGAGAFLPKQGGRDRLVLSGAALHAEKQANATDSPEFYLPSGTSGTLNDDVIHVLYKLYH